jgi:hypothetical protein
MADDKEPLPRWVIRYVIVPVVVALITALITGGVLFARRDGGNDKASTAGTATTAPTTTSAPPIMVPPARGGAEVRACMAQHQMSRAVTTSTTHVEARGTFPGETPEAAEPDTVIILKRCDWPPKPWSEGDGYSEIRVQPTIGPGESEAAGANTADVIKSSCNLLELSYSIAAQGYQESLPTFTSKPNRKVFYDGKEYRVPPEKPLNFYHERDELVVLRISKIRLDGVRCVK